MPFTYSTPVNPYAPSIGEILLHSGDAAARAAEATAAARARATEIGGQAWATAAQQAGQTIAAIPGQIAQQKRVAQEDQMRGIELQKAQAGQKVGALITANTKTTPDGHLVYDVDGFATAAKGDPAIAPWAHEPLDAMTKANDTYQQFKEGRFATKQAALQGVFAKAYEAGGTPDDVQVIAQPLISAGIISADDIAPVVGRLGQIPDQAARATFLRALGGVKPIYEKLGKDENLLNVTPGSAPAVVASGPAGAPTAEEAMTDAYVGSLGLPKGAKWADLSPQQMAAFPAWKTTQSADMNEPITIKTMENGKPVEKVMTKADALKQGLFTSQPPASVQVLNNMPGGATNEVAKMIADYKIPPPTARTLATPAGELLMAAVKAANPDYDSTMFGVRAPTRKAFTTGTQGQQITAMNTAIEHLDMLQSAADALNNGNFKPGNAAYNYLSDLFGGAPPTSYEAIKEKVDKEVDAVASKGVPTVSGSAAQKAIAGTSAGPQQIKAYIDAMLPLMGSSLNALHYQYKQAMGENDPWKPLTPEAEAVLAKRGIKIGAAPPATGAAKKGDTKPIEGFPGTEQTFDGAKWIRTK